MLSKKYYEVFADLLNEVYFESEKDGHKDAVYKIAERMCRYFQYDNPDFNDFIFEQRCGFFVDAEAAKEDEYNDLHDDDADIPTDS